MDTNLYKYVLMLGDNAMILGHRLSELCGHGPTLETDIALTNISLDLFGQVRSYFQYAAQLKGQEMDEDKLAFLRKEREYYNVILVEQPNTNFAYVIGRQYLFDVYHKLLLHQLCNSSDATISAIAHKGIKEVNYHERFSGEWIKRLGNGTEESQLKMQNAIDDLLPFAFELFAPAPFELEMANSKAGFNPKDLEESYMSQIENHLREANLNFPESKARVCKGKSGIHSEHLGYILAELQFMQRTYPEMQW